MAFEINTSIPLYGCLFILNVSKDVVAARKTKTELFGEYDGSNDGTVGGMASADKGAFAVFLNEDYLKHGVISHEIFHVTHRVMEHVGDKFSMKNQESYAYLNEWLTNWVYFQLEQNNLRIL